MSEGPNLAVIGDGKSDTQKAAEYKARIIPLLEQVCGIIGEARRDGMRTEFHLGIDAFGRDFIASLNLVKVL